MKEEFQDDFLRKGVLEGPKTAAEYEMVEMEANLSAFTEEERPVVEKFLRQESLGPKEADVLKIARDRWFEANVGEIPQAKSARREAIQRKFAPSEELVAAHKLQERMFSEFAAGADAASLSKLKEEYLEAYPDQTEGVELLFSARPFLELSRRLGDSGQRIENDQERMRAFQDITEYTFLLNHFVATNGGDKEFLGLFWSSLEKIAASGGFSFEFDLIRKGTVTQVATMKILEKLGMHPKMSHPRNDAFDKIDLWSDEFHAVQIKSTRAETPEVFETDEIAWPGAEVVRDGRAEHYNSAPAREMAKFKAKVARYGRFTKNPGLKGYFIVIPRSKVDFTTGEPDAELVEIIGEKIQSKGGTAKAA